MPVPSRSTKEEQSRTRRSPRAITRPSSRLGAIGSDDGPLSEVVPASTLVSGSLVAGVDDRRFRSLGFRRRAIASATRGSWTRAIPGVLCHDGSRPQPPTRAVRGQQPASSLCRLWFEAHHERDAQSVRRSERLCQARVPGAARSRSGSDGRQQYPSRSTPLILGRCSCGVPPY